MITHIVRDWLFSPCCVEHQDERVAVAYSRDYNEVGRAQIKWIKGLISNVWLNFLYTVQLLISNVCSKFQNFRSGSFGETFDKNFHMHYLGVRD